MILLDAEPIEARVLVWDAHSGSFCAALTVTDFIGAIHHAKDDFSFVTKTLAWLLDERAKICGRARSLITATASTA